MTESDSHADRDIPWQQRIYERIWWLAGAAILFWVLSYIAWGLFDISRVPPG